MQWKTATFSALLSIASVAQALTLDTPAGVVLDGETLTIGIQSSPQDPAIFDMLLTHANPAEVFTVGSHFPTIADDIDFTIPCVGSLLDGWVLEAVSSTDHNVVLATTAPFTITQGPKCQ